MGDHPLLLEAVLRFQVKDDPKPFLIRKTLRGWLYNTQEYYIIRMFCRVGPYRSLEAAEYILKWAHWAEETVLR